MNPCQAKNYKFRTVKFCVRVSRLMRPVKDAPCNRTFTNRCVGVRRRKRNAGLGSRAEGNAGDRARQSTDRWIMGAVNFAPGVIFRKTFCHMVQLASPRPILAVDAASRPGSNNWEQIGRATPRTAVRKSLKSKDGPIHFAAADPTTSAALPGEVGVLTRQLETSEPHQTWRLSPRFRTK